MTRLLRPTIFDLALAAALVALGQTEAWTTGSAGSHGLRAACLLVATAPLAMRRRAPVTAMWIAAAGLVVEGLTMDATNSLAELIAGLFLAYSLARFVPLERAMPGVPALAVGVVVHRVASPGSRTAADVIFDVVFVSAAWALGAAARRRQLRADEAERHAAEVEAGRVAAERDAAAGERLRIARELHDIVAHALGVIAVQAGAAEAVLESDPATARAIVASIRGMARESVTEMRRVPGCCEAARPTRASRSRGWRISRRSSAGSAAQGSTSRSSSRARPARSAREWSSPPTGSSRRRSRTSLATPRRTVPRCGFATERERSPSRSATTGGGSSRTGAPVTASSA